MNKTFTEQVFDTKEFLVTESDSISVTLYYGDNHELDRVQAKYLLHLNYVNFEHINNCNDLSCIQGTIRNGQIQHIIQIFLA